MNKGEPLTLTSGLNMCPHRCVRMHTNVHHHTQRRNSATLEGEKSIFQNRQDAFNSHSYFQLLSNVVLSRLFYEVHVSDQVLLFSFGQQGCHNFERRLSSPRVALDLRTTVLTRLSKPDCFCTASCKELVRPSCQTYSLYLAVMVLHSAQESSCE